MLRRAINAVSNTPERVVLPHVAQYMLFRRWRDIARGQYLTLSGKVALRPSGEEESAAAETLPKKIDGNRGGPWRAFVSEQCLLPEHAGKSAPQVASEVRGLYRQLDEAERTRLEDKGAKGRDYANAGGLAFPSGRSSRTPPNKRARLRAPAESLADGDTEELDRADRADIVAFGDLSHSMPSSGAQLVTRSDAPSTQELVEQVRDVRYQLVDLGREAKRENEEALAEVKARAKDVPAAMAEMLGPDHFERLPLQGMTMVTWRPPVVEVAAALRMRVTSKEEAEAASA